jgi:hypothetical protein
MKRPCRQFLRSVQTRARVTWQEMFPHARVVTDPKKMAQLEAEIARRKREDSTPRSLH